MSLKETVKKGIRYVSLAMKEKELLPIVTPVNTGELLKGKIALITGGSSGIGYAMAREFIDNGCKVIIAGRNKEKLEKMVKQLEQEDHATYMILDVNQTEKLPDKVCEAAELFPEEKIDILVNSAGVVAQNDFFHISESEYDSIMNTNAKGTFFMSQAVGKYMIENHVKGHILNVTSSSALRPAWTPYEMSKWAVRGFTKGLADILLPYGIIVNAIAPGPTATPMLKKGEGESLYNATCPAGRFAIPEEIARLAVFMVSGCGDMIVGDTFYMTGGSGIISYHR